MTPTPSATGAQVHRWRRYGRFAAWRLGREDSTWGKAVGPHAKAGDDGASGPTRGSGLFSLGSGWERGFWRVTSSPEDEGRKLPVSLERTGSSWGHVHMAGEDKDGAGRPQRGGAGAPGRRGESGPQERWGWRVLVRKIPPPHPPTLSHLPPLPCVQTAACSPLRALGAWGKVSTRSPAGRGSGNCHQRAKGKTPGSPLRSEGLPGAAPHPCRGRGQGWGGGDGVRSTSRHTQPGSPRSTGTGGSSPRV